MSWQFLGFPKIGVNAMLNPQARRGNAPVYWLIGAACLAIWFVWFIGYSMGKDAAWRELGRAGGYNLQQKVLVYRAYRNRSKKLARAALVQAKKR
jgi:hypothetical protein